MIENPPIVKDTRRVRAIISERFDNDPDQYIDYLLSQKIETGKSDVSSKTEVTEQISVPSSSN